MWTETTRAQHGRAGLRYASNLKDEEWAPVEPLLPTSRLGRPRRVDLREVLNAILYMLRTGCQWRMLPREFPAKSTVQSYSCRWRDDGTWQRLGLALPARDREAAGRAPAPTAGIVDSRSAKTAESGGPRGHDAGKKVKGRKRHIPVDTGGRLVAAKVQPADVQDRDGAPELLAEAGERFPELRLVFADGAYAGPKLADALRRLGDWTLRIVKRGDAAAGFAVLPRRWVVERTFAWLGRNRRLAKDFEATLASALAWLLVASIQLLVRRLANAWKSTTYFSARLLRSTCVSLTRMAASCRLSSPHITTRREADPRIRGHFRSNPSPSRAEHSDWVDRPGPWTPVRSPRTGRRAW